MAEDERRNKIHAENLFYLELRHKHGGNFEAMLTPDELTIWNIFPDFHKRLFTHWRDWEYLTKTSLQYFESSDTWARGVTFREVAWSRFNHYRRLSAHCKKYLSLDELADFLFPLIEVKGDYLKQEIIEAIREGTLDPAELKRMDSSEWEQYESGIYGVNSQWLTMQSNDYLKQCAAVWKIYLQAASMPPQTKDKSGKKPETQEQIDRWNKKVEQYYQPRGRFKFHAAYTHQL